MSSDVRRVSVVTGGGRGIGKATADLLSERGFTTIRISRTLDESDMNWRCDVGDEQDVSRVFKEIGDRYGRLDALVNAAGVVSMSGPLDVAVSEWMDIMRTNVIGAYLCCKHAIPLMSRRHYGRVVNVSSIASRGYSETASVAYTASKYALNGLTRQLAVNFAKDGICINCVCPSQTRTEMVAAVPADELANRLSRSALGRLAEPDEVAEAIAFLASEGASYVNGALVDVNGGS
ncbi:MAG: 3-ketoacyl-ACP reductase [Acidobacteria bacterium]|nr:3-ketoacyl-ACP reductase [Acidobacteriota bacterium]|tara:strand:- start:19 stop:720 length:702 start_codon:yes stop_codon:yes gene_type:complete